MPDVGDAYDGDCNVSIQGPRLHVDRADRRIRISDDLIREMKPGSHPDAQITDDGLLRIDAVNRTVVYRLIDSDGFTTRAELVEGAPADA